MFWCCLLSHGLEQNSLHRSTSVPWELLFLPVMNVMAPDWHFGFLWEIASPAGTTSYFAIRRTWNGPMVRGRGYFPSFRVKYGKNIQKEIMAPRKLGGGVV